MFRLLSPQYAINKKGVEVEILSPHEIGYKNGKNYVVIPCSMGEDDEGKAGIMVSMASFDKWESSEKISDENKKNIKTDLKEAFEAMGVWADV